MLAAGPAVARECIAQVFPGTMQPDGEIVFAQTQFRRDFAGVRPVEVDALQQFPILLRHGGQEPLEALAKQLLFTGAGSIRQLM